MLVTSEVYRAGAGSQLGVGRGGEPWSPTKSNKTITSVVLSKIRSEIVVAH